ncbi:MAG: MscL family protein [Candidatus Thermoplasmatota archaeon]|jgi:large conductance mechanosensitive channel|nr:MscL family protein [Candidatus Thermoplasmatota archaeon]MCL5668355.1 MscL family protein [Candidatus Thermoplasmatota archaeon]
MADDAILEELRKIRTLLEPKPSPPKTPPKNFLGEFKDFLSQYKVMGMAVAFILGLYLGTLVQALVTDLLMPIIQYATPPGVVWQDISLGPFLVGQFLGALITFLLVVVVIFLIVKVSERANVK